MPKVPGEHAGVSYIMPRAPKKSEIPKKLQKCLTRLISAHADMGYASEAFWLLQATAVEESRYHFFSSMVVSYCRPFTENNGLGPLTAEYPNFPDFPDAEMNERHRRMLAIRHNFQSHSSAEGSRIFLLAPGVPHPATGEVRGYHYYAVAKRHFLHPEFAPWLFEVIKELADRLDSDIKAVLAKCGSRFLQPGETRPLDTGAETFAWPSTPSKPPRA